MVSVSNNSCKCQNIHSLLTWTVLRRAANTTAASGASTSAAAAGRAAAAASADGPGGGITGAIARLRRGWLPLHDCDRVAVVVLPIRERHRVTSIGCHSSTSRVACHRGVITACEIDGSGHGPRGGERASKDGDGSNEDEQLAAAFTSLSITPLK